MYSKLFELHAELFKALSHPRRLEIVQLLRDQTLCVSDIYEMLDLPQANISQHLMILREAGVVSTTREGKQILYQIVHPDIINACDLIRDVLIDTYPELENSKYFALSMKELVPLTHDPVCKMRVSPKTAGCSTEFRHKTYYFCASGCLKKFSERPSYYAE